MPSLSWMEAAMPDPNRDKRFLDAIADLLASEAPTERSEVQEHLRIEGIDPKRAVKNVLAEVRRRTWRVQANREMAADTRRARPPRPAGVTRDQMLLELRRHDAHGYFRNAEKFSDDDLWDIICDQRELGDDDE